MRPDDACHSTTFALAVKARNIAANTRVAFANTQRVPGIVTQSSSILYIYGMYIYICYYTLVNESGCYQLIVTANVAKAKHASSNLFPGGEISCPVRVGKANNRDM